MANSCETVHAAFNKKEALASPGLLTQITLTEIFNHA